MCGTGVNLFEITDTGTFTSEDKKNISVFWEYLKVPIRSTYDTITFFSFDRDPF